MKTGIECPECGRKMTPGTYPKWICLRDSCFPADKKNRPKTIILKSKNYSAKLPDDFAQLLSISLNGKHLIFHENMFNPFLKRPDWIISDNKIFFSGGSKWHIIMMLQLIWYSVFPKKYKLQYLDMKASMLSLISKMDKNADVMTEYSDRMMQILEQIVRYHFLDIKGLQLSKMGTGYNISFHDDGIHTKKQIEDLINEYRKNAFKEESNETTED